MLLVWTEFEYIYSTSILWEGSRQTKKEFWNFSGSAASINIEEMLWIKWEVASLTLAFSHFMLAKKEGEKVEINSR